MGRDGASAGATVHVFPSEPRDRLKNLVTAHGGEVGVDSDLGLGTTVWFTLKGVS